MGKYRSIMYEICSYHGVRNYDSYSLNLDNPNTPYYITSWVIILYRVALARLVVESYYYY